jgi:hypothetical protein
MGGYSTFSKDREMRGAVTKFSRKGGASGKELNPIADLDGKLFGGTAREFYHGINGKDGGVGGTRVLGARRGCMDDVHDEAISNEDHIQGDFTVFHPEVYGARGVEGEEHPMSWGEL